jgi:outer membrane immunogenic protein
VWPKHHSHCDDALWADDGWLFYATGGAAWAGIDATTAASEATLFAASNTTSFSQGGAVVGGGAELHLAGPWTAKVEYLFMDLGSISDTLVLTPPASGTLTTNSTIYDHVVRVGLNYKFNWSSPLSARD